MRIYSGRLACTLYEKAIQRDRSASATGERNPARAAKWSPATEMRLGLAENEPGSLFMIAEQCCGCVHRPVDFSCAV